MLKKRSAIFILVSIGKKIITRQAARGEDCQYQEKYDIFELLKSPRQWQLQYFQSIEDGNQTKFDANLQVVQKFLNQNG